MNRVPTADLFFAEDGLTYRGREPFTGVGVELRDDGSLASEVEYRDGLRSGAARGWYPNGQLAEEVHNRLGVAHGSWREYEKDGALALEQELEHGILLWARARRRWPASRDVSPRGVEPGLRGPSSAPRIARLERRRAGLIVSSERRTSPGGPAAALDRRPEAHFAGRGS